VEKKMLAKKMAEKTAATAHRTKMVQSFAWRCFAAYFHRLVVIWQKNIHILQ